MADTQKLLAVAGLGIVLGALLSMVALNFYGNNLVTSGMVSPYACGMTPEMTKMMAGMMGSGTSGVAGSGMGGMMQGMMGSGAGQGTSGMMGKGTGMQELDFPKALEEAKKAGLTEAQLKEKGEQLMEAMMGKEMHEEMEEVTPQETHELMELRMGLLASGYAGSGMGAGQGMCPMCAKMMGSMGGMQGETMDSAAKGQAEKAS